MENRIIEPWGWHTPTDGEDIDRDPLDVWRGILVASGWSVLGWAVLVFALLYVGGHVLVALRAGRLP